jgi:hypothetical protein
MSRFARPPDIDFANGETLLSPSESGEGHWVGAPCVHSYDGQRYLGARWRTPQDRGHRVAIYEYEEGNELRECRSITAADLGVVSIERMALCTNPQTGKLQCFLPVDRGGNDWVIQKLADAQSPEEFDPETAHTVLTPDPGTSDAGTVKDPAIVTVGGRYFMFYAGFDGVSEQAHLATSRNGEVWTKHDANPVIPRGDWHDHHVRVSTVVPAPDAPAWLVFYDGSGVTDHERTWNLRTGVAVSPDLERITDTSPDGPQYSAPSADRATGVNDFATCRYLDIRLTDDQWEVFAEVARADESFELRRVTVPTSAFA